MKTPYYNVPNLQKIADLYAEIERLKQQVKAAFFRGSDFTSSYHGVQTSFDVIEKAFSEFELEQADAARE